MANLDYKQFSKRRRPHIHPPGAVLFVTYRLIGSVPKSTVREYKARKEWLENEFRRALRVVQDDEAPELKKWLDRIQKFNRDWFLKFEEILHQANHGPMWMRDERVAEKVAESLLRLDAKAYRLDAYSVMSNHVHTVFKPFVSETDLREIKGKDGHPLFISDYPSLSKIMHSVKGRSARECNQILGGPGNFGEPGDL